MVLTKIIDKLAYSKLGDWIANRGKGWNALCVGLTASLAYTGLYSHFRKPTVLDTLDHKGKPIYVIGQKNRKFPGNQTIDEMLWNFPKTETHFDESTGEATHAVIDLTNLYRTGEIIKAHWDKFKDNERKFERDIPDWSPIKKAIYDLMKSYERDEIPEAYKKVIFLSDLAHEKDHLEKGMSDNRIIDEEGSHFAECGKQENPKACLPRVTTYSAKKNEKIVKAYRTIASRNVLNCLKKQTNTKDREFFLLTENQFRNASRKCSKRLHEPRNKLKN